MQEEGDVPYEEEILRHPFQVKCWMRYVDHKKATGAKGSTAAVNMIYERALKQLPGRCANVPLYCGMHVAGSSVSIVLGIGSACYEVVQL